jgi:hypothetical protein
MKCLFYLLFNLFLSAGLTAQPYGLGALEQLETLPLLRRATSCHQVSSFERNGGNADRNCWLYIDDVGDYVIFDDIGAGCIYRLWMTHGGQHPEYKANYASNTLVRIYIDDDVMPRFECSIEEFFSGEMEPFVKPLVGEKSDSSGGLYAYVPIPYKGRCRISVTDIPSIEMRNLRWGEDAYWMYYNITYHRYASADGVVSWLGDEGYASVLNQYDHIGLDPKTTTNMVCSGTLELAGASMETLLDQEWAGVLNHLQLEMPVLNATSWTNLYLSCKWDGQDDLSWTVPLADFFCSPFKQVEVGGLLLGSSNQLFYCYFPMPFWESAQVNIENRGTESISNIVFSVGVGENVYAPEASGYFMAHHAVANYTNNIVGSDFIALDQAGRGHYVGMNLACTGAGKIYGNGLTFLEGDERIYIDGSLSPQLHGTGNEDYFNGGWYYNLGSFSLPYHGSPVRSSPFSMSAETNWISAYRIHVGDIVPFYSSIKVGMEHGGNNEVGCHMSSVAYYYFNPVSGLESCLELDVGNPEAEQAGQYQFSDAAMVTNVYGYAGDAHDSLSSDSGYELSSSAFSLQIPSDNDGILIRRKSDVGTGRQNAEVYVNDQFVGYWYWTDNSYSNVNTRWVDCEFLVPFHFTAGKSQVELKFQAVNGCDWNEYGYSIFAVSAVEGAGDLDADGIPDEWEAVYFATLSACVPSDDLDGDSFSNEKEFLCLTDPVDADSKFEIFYEGADSISFHAASSRLYTVAYTTNLLSPNWTTLKSVSGTGTNELVSMSSENSHQAFYRIEVNAE